MSGRCRACDCILDEFEMTRQWPNSEDYCDLCTHCLDMSDPDEVQYSVYDENFEVEEE